MQSMRIAIKKGNLDAVKAFLSEHEGLQEVDTVFGSWLHVAAAHGKYDIAKYLIEKGMDVNRNGDLSGGNPLNSAAETGHLDIVELLYQNGAKLDVSQATKNPLFGAIYSGHFDIVKFLVEHGIDITAQYHIGTIENCDAAEYARQFGQTEIYHYLIQKKESAK